MKAGRSFTRRAALFFTGWAIAAASSCVLYYSPALAQLALTTEAAEASDSEETSESSEPLSKQDLLQQHDRASAEWLLEASSEDKPTSASTLPAVPPPGVGAIGSPAASTVAAPAETFQLQLGQEVLVDDLGPQRPARNGLARLLPPTPVVLRERSTGRSIILDSNTTVVLAPNAGPIASALNTVSPSQNVSLPSEKVAEARGEELLYPLPFRVPLSSGFGMRNHPISGDRAFHQGLDLAASYGTPVLAAFSGQVAVAGPSGGLGNAVMLAHTNSMRTRYGHMSRVIVQPGDWIYQGDVLGYVGSTGNSTGPHLHFEIWTRSESTPWTAIDPSGQIQLAVARL